MVTRVLFSGLLAAVALQRLVELGHSRRNERALRARGAIEHAPAQLVAMKALHAGWLAGTALEVWVKRTGFVWPWSMLALVGFVAGQGLRSAARRELGPRWTVRVMTLPQVPLVQSGIYRRLRHPNYAGVVLEIACLPLVCGAWRSAIAFSAAHAALLRARIRVEDGALNACATTPSS